MHFRRTVSEDLVLGDQQVRAGDKGVVWFGAAHRDLQVVPSPHRLDLLRKPNPHLAFGFGPHFCLGAQLAHLETTVMLAELLRTWPVLELDGPPVRVVSNFVNGIKGLPVKLRSANSVSRSMPTRGKRLGSSAAASGACVSTRPSPGWGSCRGPR